MFHFNEATSTMDEAERLITQKRFSADFVVASDIQTQGRGRKGNIWYSDKGGLWFTLCLYNYTFYPSLMIYTGLIIRRTIFDLFQLSDLTIKWPNDVYIQGKKCCGMIANYNSLHKYHQIGIGINTNNSIPSNTSNPAVSLSEILNREVSNNDILNHFLELFYQNLTQYQNYNLETFIDEFNQFHLLNQKLVDIVCGDESFTGICTGIEPDGAITLLLQDGSKKIIYAGTVIINP